MGIELIVWQDIASHFGGDWRDSVDECETWTMYTTGWVIKEDKHSITVCSSRGDPKRDPCYGHDTTIPVGCIIRRTVLRKHWQ